MAKTITMYVSLVGEPDVVDTGGWCDDCLLPSVVAIRAVVNITSRPGRIGQLQGAEWRTCHDCGRET